MCAAAEAETGLEVSFEAGQEFGNKTDNKVVKSDKVVVDFEVPARTKTLATVKGFGTVSQVEYTALAEVIFEGMLQ